MLRFVCSFRPALVCSAGPRASPRVAESPGKLELSYSSDVGNCSTVFILDGNLGNDVQKSQIVMPKISNSELGQDSCIFIGHYAVETDFDKKPPLLRTTLAGQSQFFLYDIAEKFKKQPSATNVVVSQAMTDYSTEIRKGEVILTFERENFMSAKLSFVERSKCLRTEFEKERYKRMTDNYIKLSRVIMDCFASLGPQANNVRIPPYAVNSLEHIPGVFSLIRPAPSEISYWWYMIKLSMKRQNLIFRDDQEIEDYYVNEASDQEIVDLAMECAFIFTSYMSYMPDYTMDPETCEFVPCERFEVSLRTKTVHGLAVGCDCEDMAWSICSVLWELERLSSRTTGSKQKCLHPLLRRISSVLSRHEFLMTLKSVTSAAYKSTPSLMSSSSDKPHDPLDDRQGGHMDVTVFPRTDIGEYSRRYQKHPSGKWLPPRKSKCLATEIVTVGKSQILQLPTNSKTRTKFGEGTEWIHPDGGDSGISKMSMEKLSSMIGIKRSLEDALQDVRSTTKIGFRAAAIKSAEMRSSLVRAYRHEHVIERDKNVMPFYRQAISFFCPRALIEHGVPVLGGYFLTGTDGDGENYKIGATVPDLMHGPKHNNVAIVFDPPLTRRELDEIGHAMRFLPQVPPFDGNIEKRASIWSPRSDRFNEAHELKVSRVEPLLAKFQQKFMESNCIKSINELYLSSGDGHHFILKGKYVAVDIAVRFDELRDEFFERLTENLSKRSVITFDYNWEIVHIDHNENFPIGGLRMRLYFERNSLSL